MWDMERLCQYKQKDVRETLRGPHFRRMGGQGARGLDRQKLAKPRSQSLQLPPHFPT